MTARSSRGGRRRPHPDRDQHGRPADPGRLPRALLRDEPRPGLRPRGRDGHAARHPRRDLGALRARRREGRHPRRARRLGHRAGPAPRRRRPGGPGGRIPGQRVVGGPRGLRRAVRPDHGRPPPAGGHRPDDPGRGGPQPRPGRWRRGGVRRRQGDPRVDGPVAGHPRRGRGRPRHHRRARPRPLGRGEGRRRRARRAHRRAGQGREPGHDGRGLAGARHRPLDGDPGRQRPDPHRGRGGLPRPPHQPAAAPRGDRLGGHDDDRRWHRPRGGHEGDHGDAGRVVARADVRGAGLDPAELPAARQGQHRRRRRPCASRSARARPGSRSTRTGARRRRRSTRPCAWPTRPGYRSRCTPTR